MASITTTYITTTTPTKNDNNSNTWTLTSLVYCKFTSYACLLYSLLLLCEHSCNNSFVNTEKKAAAMQSASCKDAKRFRDNHSVGVWRICESRRRMSSFSVCVYMYIYSYICVCVVDCVCLWRHYPSACFLLPCFVQMWVQLLLLSLFKATTVWKVNVSGFCFCFCESGKQLKSVEQKGFTQWIPFLQQPYSFLSLAYPFCHFLFCLWQRWQYNGSFANICL